MMHDNVNDDDDDDDDDDEDDDDDDDDDDDTIIALSSTSVSSVPKKASNNPPMRAGARCPFAARCAGHLPLRRLLTGADGGVEADRLGMRWTAIFFRRKSVGFF